MHKYLLVIFVFLAPISSAHAQAATGFFFLDNVFASHRCEQEACKCENARSHGFLTLAIKFCTEGLSEPRLTARQQATLLMLRGWAYEKGGHYDEAIADLTTAYERGDTDYLKAQSLSFRGVTYFHKFEDAKALADMTAAMAILPRAVGIYNARGYIYGYSGDEKSALADFSTAIEKQRDNTWYIVYTRGSMYFHEEKFADARNDFEEMVRMNHKDPEAVLQLHLASLNAGVDDAAEFRKNADHANLENWPGPLVKLMLGDISQQDAQAAVHNGDYKYYEPMDRTCEETFVSAEWQRFEKKDKDAARTLYQQVAQYCSRADDRVEAQNALKHL